MVTGDGDLVRKGLSGHSGVDILFLTLANDQTRREEMPRSLLVSSVSDWPHRLPLKPQPSPLRLLHPRKKKTPLNAGTTGIHCSTGHPPAKRPGHPPPRLPSPSVPSTLLSLFPFPFAPGYADRKHASAPLAPSGPTYRIHFTLPPFRPGPRKQPTRGLSSHSLPSFPPTSHLQTPSPVFFVSS